MRIHLGSGWRLYYIQQDAVIFVLLAGGSKRTQDKDIKRAKALVAAGLELAEEQKWLNA